MRLLGLERAEDRAIWNYAKEKAFVLVSTDADFVDTAGVLGAPPKVIRLRCGNQPTPVIEALLRKHLDLIADFAGDNSACLKIY